MGWVVVSRRGAPPGRRRRSAPSEWPAAGCGCIQATLPGPLGVQITLEVAVAPAPLTVPPDQRDLVVALAALTLERSAPEELAVLEDTASEYFEDPAAVLSPDQPLGFGLDVALLAPYALAVAAAVVQMVLGAARACRVRP